MSAAPMWRRSLRLFFSERAREIEGTPTLEDLCYISGREPRLWLRADLFDDLIEAIIAKIRVTRDSTILEVGCASGFLARGLAPRVRRYFGTDLSAAALEVARRLHFPNAEYRVADWSKLPFTDSSFDSALCYDVFTNFPEFASGVPVIREMLRVVKPGGRCLIGSIPDREHEATYPARVSEVTAELDAQFGAAKARAGRARRGLLSGVNRLLRIPGPGITCYYFDKGDFLALGKDLGAATTISDVHARNPYLGYRYDVVYTNPA